MNGTPNQQMPVARIEVVLMPNGAIQCQAAVPNRQTFLMMMETAKFDIERALFQKEKEKIKLPPVGLKLEGIRE